MNSILSRRNLRHAGALVAAYVLTSAAMAQFVPSPVKWDAATAKESWVSLSGGWVSVDGSDATYQRLRQHDHRGFYGVDELKYKQTLDNDQTLTVNGRVMLQDNEYRLGVRWDNTATGTWFEGGWKESRVFYDGTGGFLSNNDQWFVPFNPDLAIDRGEFWLEAGRSDEKTSTVLHYSHLYRNGMKDSTSWGDTNLTGGLGTRAIVPSFWDIDETRDIVTLDVDYTVSPETTVGAGARWENINTDNSRNIRRRPDESSDRNLTHRDTTDSDLFALHGFTTWKKGEKLTLSAAAAHTSIDTNFSGSRIFGATFDAVFDPTFSRRQQRDEGYASLDGDSKWKQTLVTANALYLPAKHWRVSGGLRYENQHQEVFSEFAETNVGGGPNFVTAIEDLEGDSSRHFDEILGSVEAGYTGLQNMVWGFFAEASSGDGNLSEDLIEAESGVLDINRDTDFSRDSHKIGANVRWYPTATFNGALGVYHKVRDNAYDVSDPAAPPPTGGDRYPAYIISQKFSTDDLNVRGTLRPGGGFSLVGRYDYQQTDIDSMEAGLTGVLSGEMTSHILAGTVSFMPSSNVVLQGTINKVYDQVITGAVASNQPLAHAAGRFDNNYSTASFLAMFAVDEASDLQVDATFFKSDNFRDVTTITMPYGLTATDKSYGISYSRRMSEDMVIGVRYARADYNDTTSGGNRDFTADMVYGRLQMRF